MTSRAKKVGLLGPFGYGNLGDAAIQQAMIYHLHKYRPDAQVYGFSLNPEDTERRHGIPCYPISWIPEGPGGLLRKIPRRIQQQPLIKFLLKVLVRMPAEALLTVRSFIALSGFDVLIVSGGGQLDDYWGGAWGHPFTLLRWALIAKLRRTKLLIVSVGAGPLDSALSRFFTRQTLSLANYRSYRDESSKRFIRNIGFGNQKDPVYPDLAYSLPVIWSEPAPRERVPTVGVGPMAYCDPRVWPQKDRSLYWGYLQKLAAFVTWLIDKNYRVLLFTGESIHDRWAIDDLKAILKEQGEVNIDKHVLEPAIESVDDLICHIATTDLVVASRLHGVLLSHLMLKPVLAISYHEKIDALMADLGQSEYCVNINTLELEALKKRFIDLESRQKTLKVQIEKRIQTYRSLLEEQYEQLFRHL